MAAKRQKAQKLPDMRAQVVEAVLALADARAWEDVGLADIAAQAGISLADLMNTFECRDDILAAVARHFDRQAMEAFGQRDSSCSDRDALFDMMMARYEAFNEHRAAVLSIMRGVLRDPKMLVVSLPHAGRSMVWVLEACRIDTSGWRGAARVAGLMGVNLYAARAWMDDDTPDLSKTMAALDAALSRTENWAERFGF